MSEHKVEQQDEAAGDSHKKTTRIPLRITDTTLRDAHQSLWATRMRTADMEGILETIDGAGYYSLEVWGGATFDVCLRFLRENPWERLRFIKAHCKKTPLQMLLRGQNVLGYRHYPDDVLERTVALACENGMDIFRIFDALNDTRNLAKAIQFVKKYGGHAQGTICYTTSPVHTVREYVRVAKEQVDMGIDSLCIKDMAGILSPMSCRKLVSALVRELDIPVQIHSHATSGMATATYVEGVVAGAGAIDCAISSMAGMSSQPPVETMLAIFDETSYHANLDVAALRKICKHFQDLARARKLVQVVENPIDPEILIHHIPGGMISNLRSQLAQQNALDRLDEVLKELPLVRADMGFPPLVTPTSQIVGVQAVLNVLAGERYAMIPQETKDYVRGLYGKSPAPINPKIKKRILGNEKPITCRPADLIEPMLPSATQGVDQGLIKSEEDIISFCMFPEIALDYFKWRKLPAAERPLPPVEEEERKRKQTAPATPPAPPATPLMTDQDYREIQALVDKVQALGLSELTIRRDDLTLSLKGSGMAAEKVASAPAGERPAPKPAEARQAATVKTEAPAATGGPAIAAPLNGTFYRASGPGKPPFVNEGDKVKAGDVVCIVEAMKLFNQIKAPCDAKIGKFLVEHGKPVTKGQALVSYESA